MADGEQVCKGLGWTMMAVREGRERLPLYDGSPRALYSLKQPSSSPQGKQLATSITLSLSLSLSLSHSLTHSLTHSFSHSPADGGLVPVAGCILSISLTPHPVLSRAVHLFPQHVLITFDDIIPGTIHTSIPEGKWPSCCCCTTTMMLPSLQHSPK